MRRRATVGRHHDRRAGRDRRLYARLGQIVAILEAPRHEGYDPAAERAECPRQQCGGRHAVHVVVPVYENHFPALDRLHETPGRGVETTHQFGIVQLVESRPQEPNGRVGLRVPAGME